MITFTCPCGKVLKVPEEHVGKRGRCKACGAVQVVPIAQLASAASEPKDVLPSELVLREERKNVATNSAVRTLKVPEPSNTQALASSADGQWLLSAGLEFKPRMEVDTCVSLWNQQTGRRVYRQFVPGKISDLAISRDCTYAHLLFSNGSLLLWNLKVGRALSTIVLAKPSDNRARLRVLPRRDQILVYDDDSFKIVATTGKTMAGPYLLKDRAPEQPAVNVAADGRYVLFTRLADNKSRYSVCPYSKNAKEHGDVAVIWDLETCQEIHRLQSSGVPSPGGRYLLTFDYKPAKEEWYDKRVISTCLGDEAMTEVAPYETTVREMRILEQSKFWSVLVDLGSRKRQRLGEGTLDFFSSDGRYAAGCNPFLIHVVGCEPPFKTAILGGHKNRLDRVMFTEDGGSIVAGDYLGNIHIWKLELD